MAIPLESRIVLKGYYIVLIVLKGYYIVLIVLKGYYIVLIVLKSYYKGSRAKCAVVSCQNTVKILTCSVNVDSITVTASGSCKCTGRVDR